MNRTLRGKGGKGGIGLGEKAHSKATTHQRLWLVAVVDLHQRPAYMNHHNGMFYHF